jgi:hypothetical protein
LIGIRKNNAEKPGGIQAPQQIARNKIVKSREERVKED